MVQRTSLAAYPLRLPVSALARLRGALGRILGSAPAAPATHTAARIAGHQALELLRPLVAEFIEQPESQAPFDTLLRGLQALLGAEASVLFAIGEDGALHHLADTDEGELATARALLADDSPARHFDRDATVRVVPGPSARVLVLLPDDSRTRGCLVLRLPDGAPLPGPARVELESLATPLAGIVHGASRARLSRRLALHEERAAIARELHDSLAQSLSYLKIQVSRMQALLARHGDPASPGHAELDAVVQELRGNLNLAYRQLRELIATCRLTMNGRTLTQALEDSASEYARRSAVVVELDNRLGDTTLGAHAELHVLQIVREALANVVRHAHARRVQVSLRCEPDAVRLAVEDDGIGIDAGSRRDDASHHGLLIMQERAHELGGELRLQARDGGGTRVLVRFPPRPATRPA